MSRPAGAVGKAAALRSGMSNRNTGGRSAAQLPPDETAPAPAAPSAGRAPAGQGRRGQFRKLSLELTPEAHTQLRTWLLTAFGSDVKATPVIRALLAEAYGDPGLTDRIRERLRNSATEEFRD